MRFFAWKLAHFPQNESCVDGRELKQNQENVTNAESFMSCHLFLSVIHSVMLYQFFYPHDTMLLLWPCVCLSVCLSQPAFYQNR